VLREKRESDRVPLLGDLIVVLEKRKLPCKTSNISVGGLLFYLSSPLGLEPGDELSLILKLPGQGTWLHGKACLVHITPQGRGTAHGLCFVDPAPRFLAQVEKYIAPRLPSARHASFNWRTGRLQPTPPHPLPRLEIDESHVPTGVRVPASRPGATVHRGQRDEVSLEALARASAGPARRTRVLSSEVDDPSPAVETGDILELVGEEGLGGLYRDALRTQRSEEKRPTSSLGARTRSLT
jgi:hypothetical protein